MIYGIGLDVCSIDRISKNSDSFFRKYYTDYEIEYCNCRYSSFAGIFAAKEAFVKALGTGFMNTDLKAIEVYHSSAGAPYYRLTGWAEKELMKREIKNSFLSISHDSGIAEAFCILEK